MKNGMVAVLVAGLVGGPACLGGRHAAARQAGSGRHVVGAAGADPASLEADIARDQLPGAVLAIARRGKLVHFEAYGLDKAAGVPMATDAIFNIASMTKPMAAVAALQLYEQGRLLIDDPVAKYFPKFAEMTGRRAATKKAKSVRERVPAARPITIQDLFRHTSGLVYGGRGATPVHKFFPSEHAGRHAA